MFSEINVSGSIFAEEGYGEDICGLPQDYAKELEAGIIEGKATYEDLKAGDKVVIDKTLLYWYPDIKVGDKLCVTIRDGKTSYEKELEVAAIGDYRGGMLEYNYMIMAKEAADSLVSNNCNRYFSVIAEKDFDETLYTELTRLCEETGRVNLMARKTVYELNEASMVLMNGGSYLFLGILSAICIMNLVNTMINSVHVRKKEIGMMQAIGLSNNQLQKMLLIEGMFYTVGTLVMTLGVGSIHGYMAFLWAKKEQILRIRVFSYPWEVAGIIILVLVFVQIFLAISISKSVKKDSLIDRIRFNE